MMATAKRPSAFDVTQWLTSINCSQYITLFTENGIEEQELISQLDYESLKELGVAKVGDLVRLERSLNDMRAAEKIKTTSLVDQFVDGIVKYKLTIINNNENGHYTNNNKHHHIDNDGYFSESDTESRTDEYSKKSHLTHNNNNSTSTINSTESNESGNSNINSKESSTSNGIAALAPVTEMDKHIAVFILQNGNIKKMNTSGCYNAESIKKKLLKKLNLKASQYANYQTYFIDSNNNIHLMYDVELMSLVRSSDRVERNRIIFCKSNEDPSSEALSTSRKISCKYEVNGTSKKKSKNSSSEDDEYEDGRSKYINVNTASSAMRIEASKKKSTKKDPSYARKNIGKDLKALIEQRPPSELISSNLAEFFPETPSKELHQTIKNSVRYSVRMSRAFSRLSMMSINSNFTRNSIMNLQNSPRTIGDVWVSNASELDEAVLDEDKDFVDIMNTYKRPKSRFVPNGAPPLPEMDLNKKVTTPTNKRLSVAIKLGNDTDSRIELLDLDHVSETENENESENDFENTFDDDNPESMIKDLELQPAATTDKNTGPENWLKGKRIGAGSFGIVYLGLNSFTGELMAVKQVEIPKFDQLTVSSGSSDAGTVSSYEDASTLKGDSTLGSNKTVTKEKIAAKESDKKEKDHKQSMIDALQREMALLKELKHEKIVRYLGSSSDGTYLNIFLEYVPGGSITSMLNNYGPFKEPLIRNFTRQILIGLKYLHSKNIIHRDIKGGNILIDNNGGAKISDFGISKKIETSMQPKRASLQGSVYWMAPEVVRQITNSEKSDIWSVGCLIIEMFTGKHPFPEFSQMQAIFRIGTHSTPAIPNTCTEECKDFLKKTFIIEYEKRPSAKELLSHPFLNSLILSNQ